MGQGSFIQLYEIASMMMGVAGIAVKLVALYLAITSGRPSGSRQLLIYGIVLLLLSSGASLMMHFVSRVGTSPIAQDMVLFVYLISNLISWGGLCLVLWGAIQLLRQNSQLQYLLEEDDDE